MVQVGDIVSLDKGTASDLPPDLIEQHAVKQSVSKIDELADIFIHATKV